MLPRQSIVTPRHRRHHRRSSITLRRRPSLWSFTPALLISARGLVSFITITTTVIIIITRGAFIGPARTGGNGRESVRTQRPWLAAADLVTR